MSRTAPAGGEDDGQLARLVLGPHLRADLVVHARERLRVSGLEELAVGLLGDRLQASRRPAEPGSGAFRRSRQAPRSRRPRCRARRCRRARRPPRRGRPPRAARSRRSCSRRRRGAARSAACRRPSSRRGRSATSAPASTERTIASPSAVPLSARSVSSAASAASRSSVGGTTTSASFENDTTPTWKPSGSPSTKREAAARAAAIRSGWTSVAVIEPELSIARMTVPSSLGTATATSGRAIPISRAVSASSDEHRRDVPAPAGRAVDDVREQVDVGEAHGVAHTPPLEQDVAGERERNQRQPDQGERPAEAHRRLLSISTKRTRLRSQSPEVESTTCGDAGGTELARELLPFRDGGTRRTARGCGGCACRPAAGAVTPDRRPRCRRRPAAPARAGRGSRPRARRVRAARLRNARGQSRGPRKSETTTTAERRRARFATAAKAAPSDVEPTGRRSGSRRTASSTPSSPCRPCRGGRTTGVAVAEGGDREPVAAARSDVPERDRHALGDVPLAPVGGAEGHRRRGVEQDPRHERPLGDEDADVRLAGSGRHVPVDQPHVVGRLVRPHLRELGAFAERASAVIAREQSVDPAAHGDVEPPKRRGVIGPGPGRAGERSARRSVERSCDHPLRELVVAATARPRAPDRGSRPGRCPRRARRR